MALGSAVPYVQFTFPTSLSNSADNAAGLLQCTTPDPTSARNPSLFGASSVVLPKFRYLQANNAGPEFLAGQPGETILSEVP